MCLGRFGFFVKDVRGCKRVFCFSGFGLFLVSVSVREKNRERFVFHKGVESFGVSILRMTPRVF